MVLAVLVPSIVLSMINVPSNDAATVPNYQPIACLRCVRVCMRFLRPCVHRMRFVRGALCMRACVRA